MRANERKTNERSPRDTRAGFPVSAVREISTALNAGLADIFALYMKTKNFHWHMSGPHFRDYHLLRTSSPRRSTRSATASPSACASSAA